MAAASVAYATMRKTAWLLGG